MTTAIAVPDRRVGRRPERDGDEVAHGGDREQPDGDRLRDDQGRPGDDEREREEERALHAVGQGDEHRGPREGDGAFDDELGRAEGIRRQDVIDEDEERAGEGQQDEDRLLRIGPQAGPEDQRGRDEDEHPADDADDAVVGVGGRAVDERVVQGAGHGRRGQAILQVRARGRAIAAPCADRAAAGSGSRPAPRGCRGA